MDRRSPLPFQRLWATLSEAHGNEAARATFRQELEKGLPDGLIQAEFEPPHELRAREGERGIELSTSGTPWHPDPRMRIGYTRWQIRSEAGHYDRATVIDVTSEGGATRLFVPRHQLRPRTTYVVRASWHAEKTRGAVTSDEHRFTTGDYLFEAIAIDLSTHFDADLVANPGDVENDSIDGTTAFFVVDGYDGRSSGNARVQGLPVDGIVGLHRLANYDGPNAIYLRPQRKGSVRVELPARRYSVLRFLTAAGHGDARLPVNLVYSDGSSERQVLRFHDWFDDPGPGAESESGPLTPDTTPVLNGMDRLFDRSFEDLNDPALFETTLAVDPRKDLVAFVLEAEEFDPDQPMTRSGIFAVTGVWTGSDP